MLWLGGSRSGFQQSPSLSKLLLQLFSQLISTLPSCKKSILRSGKHFLSLLQMFFVVIPASLFFPLSFHKTPLVWWGAGRVNVHTSDCGRLFLLYLT